jgi:hypothetical protein
MPPYQFIGWVDTWALSAALRTKLKQFDNGVCLVHQRNSGWTFEIRKEWPSLWNVIRRIRTHPLAADAELGNIAILELRPHSERDWSWLPTEEPDGWVEIQVALVCNPQTFVFCGTQPVHLPIGHVCVVNRAFPRCAVNWGEASSFRLICEFRGPGDAHHDPNNSAH